MDSHGLQQPTLTAAVGFTPMFGAESTRTPCLEIKPEHGTHTERDHHSREEAEPPRERVKTVSGDVDACEPEHQRGGWLIERLFGGLRLAEELSAQRESLATAAMGEQPEVADPREPSGAARAGETAG